MALKKPQPDRGMWNSPKVGEWIENRSGHVLTHKKQRGWEYMRKLGQSPTYSHLLGEVDDDEIGGLDEAFG